MPSGENTRNRKLARQRAVLDLISGGANYHNALEKVGVHPNTVSNYWSKDKTWARALAAAKAEQPSSFKRRRSVADVPDFLEFRSRHFAYYSKRDRRWVRATNSWFQQDAVHHLENNPFLVMTLPPGHIKTTMFGVESPVWHIMRDRNWRGLHVSNSAEEAALVVSQVQERLECPYYHEIITALKEQGDEPITCPVCAYGGEEGFKPASRKTGNTWGQYSFKVIGRTAGEKDATFEAKGFGSQIQGKRADRITLDDLQNPTDAMTSPSDSLKKLQWLESVILGRINPGQGQQLVILANFFTPDDFAHQVIETKPDWPAVTYSALRPCPGECANDEECVHHDERVLCPEYWTWDDLQQKRKDVGEQTWFFTWMQEEGTFESTTFKREVLEAAKTDRYRLGDKPLEVTHLYIGLDPAWAARGHCAICVWGLNKKTKQRFLIDIFNESGMNTSQNIVSEVVSFIRAYGPRCVITEGNAQQKPAILTEENVREIRNAGTQLKTYYTATGRGASSLASNYDITTIGGLFDAGLISLPYGGTVAENSRVDAYIDQLCAWRTDDEGRSIKKLKRDMVMATLFAESEAFAEANRDRPSRPWRRDTPKFADNSWNRWKAS